LNKAEGVGEDQVAHRSLSVGQSNRIASDLRTMFRTFLILTEPFSEGTRRALEVLAGTAWFTPR
jgi:hypothetical protein